MGKKRAEKRRRAIANHQALIKDEQERDKKRDERLNSNEEKRQTEEAALQVRNHNTNKSEEDVIQKMVNQRRREIDSEITKLREKGVGQLSKQDFFKTELRLQKLYKITDEKIEYDIKKKLTNKQSHVQHKTEEGYIDSSKDYKRISQWVPIKPLYKIDKLAEPQNTIQIPETSIPPIKKDVKGEVKRVNEEYLTTKPLFKGEKHMSKDSNNRKPSKIVVSPEMIQERKERLVEELKFINEILEKDNELTSNEQQDLNTRKNEMEELLNGPDKGIKSLIRKETIEAKAFSYDKANDQGEHRKPNEEFKKIVDYLYLEKTKEHVDSRDIDNKISDVFNKFLKDNKKLSSKKYAEPKAIYNELLKFFTENGLEFNSENYNKLMKNIIDVFNNKIEGDKDHGVKAVMSMIEKLESLDGLGSAKQYRHYYDLKGTYPVPEGVIPEKKGERNFVRFDTQNKALELKLEPGNKLLDSIKDYTKLNDSKKRELLNYAVKHDEPKTACDILENCNREDLKKHGSKEVKQFVKDYDKLDKALYREQKLEMFQVVQDFKKLYHENPNALYSELKTHYLNQNELKHIPEEGIGKIFKLANDAILKELDEPKQERNFIGKIVDGVVEAFSAVKDKVKDVKNKVQGKSINTEIRAKKHDIPHDIQSQLKAVLKGQENLYEGEKPYGAKEKRSEKTSEGMKEKLDAKKSNELKNKNKSR